MLSYYRGWWKTSFFSARIPKHSRYCFISKQSNCCFSQMRITWFRNIQHLLFLPGLQSAGVAPSQGPPLGGTGQIPCKSPDSLAGWMSGGKPHLVASLGRKNRVSRSARESCCQVGCYGAVGLGPLSCGAVEEHLEALSFSAWFLGWARYLPASEATW